MRRSELLPFVISFIIALGVGLLYTWQIDPVEYVDTAPDTLRADFKSDYLALIASAYASTGNLARAQARLDLFPDPDPATTLADLAQQRLAEGRPESEARAIALLASALGEQPTPFMRTPGALETALAANPTVTPDILATSHALQTSAPTLIPSRTPTPFVAGSFELQSRELICDPALPGPLLQGMVLDAQRRQLPGVEVLVVWDTGQDHFFTGLKPELGLGYGDFSMTEGVVYAVQIAGNAVLVSDISPEECGDDGEDIYLSSWLLTFVRRSSP
jgi:hypothetical protein